MCVIDFLHTFSIAYVGYSLFLPLPLLRLSPSLLFPSPSPHLYIPSPLLPPLHPPPPSQPGCTIGPQSAQIPVRRADSAVFLGPSGSPELQGAEWAEGLGGAATDCGVQQREGGPACTRDTGERVTSHGQGWYACVTILMEPLIQIIKGHLSN